MHGKPLVEFSVDYYRYPDNAEFGPLPLLDPSSNPVNIRERENWVDALIETEASPFHKLISEHLADGSEHALLRDLLALHGIFAPRFFERNIQPHVARRFALAAIDLRHFTELWLEDYDWVERRLAEDRRERIESPRVVDGVLVTHRVGDEREDSEVRTPRRIFPKSEAIYHAANHLFLHTAARIARTEGALSDAEMWFKKFARPKLCSLCGREYRVIDLPYWVYYGSNGCIDICFACPLIASPKKKALFSLIPAFVETCGFIPPSRANPIDFAFTSRLSEQEKPKVMLAYAEMGGIEHVKKKFGSWFQALGATGALPQGVLPTPRGVRCTAKDGQSSPHQEAFDAQPRMDMFVTRSMNSESMTGYRQRASLMTANLPTHHIPN